MKAEEISIIKAQTFSATPTPADAVTPMALTMANQYNKERHADQQVLQGNGCAQPGRAAQSLAVEADVGAVHLKGQLLFADDRQ